MTQNEIWIAILVGAAVSLAVRALPLTLIRKQIRNRFIRSFLYYVPYVTLAVMTFPAMIDAARHPLAGAAALAAGAAAAWLGAGLFPVAIIACVVEYLAGLI
ncbi:MAG: AzlD domain-containing protein [Clostridia bacterium]|jgi:branched-subunit amino acid transport protein|nr:AzlD domain-containing protein [Clostridia bacterium]